MSFGHIIMCALTGEAAYTNFKRLWFYLTGARNENSLIPS